jgi:hypothetical protein
MNVGAAAADFDLDELLERLRTNSDPALTELKITKWAMLTRPADLGDALLHNSTVSTLTLIIHYLYSETDIPNLGSKQCPVAQYLSSSKHLRAVRLTSSSSNEDQFCAEISSYLLRAIGENPGITSLTCSYAVPLQPLADVMARTTSITHLELTVTKMSAPLPFVVERLSSNTALRSLLLCGDDDTSQTFFSPLLVKLAGHPQLVNLTVSTPAIPSGLCCLLQSKTNISVLFVYQNRFSFPSKENNKTLLVRAIRGNSTLQWVSLDIGIPQHQTRQVEANVERNQQMRMWFASEASALHHLATVEYWPSIFPCLLEATRPMLSAAPSSATVQHHAQPSPNAIFMALLQVNEIGLRVGAGKRNRSSPL